MSQIQEDQMTVLRRLWAKFGRFAEALEGCDDPTGDYILSLANHVDKLERRVAHLETQLQSQTASAGIRQ